MSGNSIYSVRSINNLKDMVTQSATLYGNKSAFSIKTKEDQYSPISYSEFKSDIDAFGTALLNLGLKGSFIAVLGENRYEWCITYLSTVNGVGVTVPLDKELPYTEIENLLIRSNAKAIIFSEKHEKDMRRLSATLSSVKYYINMDLVEDQDNFLSFKKLVSKGKQLITEGDRRFLDAEVDETGLGILLFTSGTTDLAKGVMLSHKNICTDIMEVCRVLQIDSNDSVLSILPLHHTYECTAGFLVMIYNGCTISFNEGLKHIAKNLKETSPTILILVPLILESMYKKIWDHASKKKSTKLKLKVALKISNFLYNILGIDIRRKLFKQIHDTIGGRVRLIITGAAAIDPMVSKGFKAMGLRAIQGYGLTECSPIVTVCRDGMENDASIGMALPGVEVKIDSPNEEGLGEIVVKGDNVMLGYFENPLATEKVLKDGWLYTGDLGRVDEKGFYYITGRKKNVIVTKNGKNIFPEEVEAYLNKSPYILECMVWGKVDEASGETLVNSQIVPDFEAIKLKLKVETPSDKDVFELINTEVKAVNKNMPLYKCIRQFTIRENEFAKTSSRKIKRYVEKTG